MDKTTMYSEFALLKGYMESGKYYGTDNSIRQLLIQKNSLSHHISLWFETLSSLDKARSVIELANNPINHAKRNTIAYCPSK